MWKTPSVRVRRRPCVRLAAHPPPHLQPAHLFFDAEDDAVVQYGDTWLEEPSLLSALCGSCSGVAFARGARLWVSRLTAHAPSSHWAVPPGATVTALAWPACAVSQSSAHDTALLLGTSQGRLVVYTPAGALLHSQRVFDAPLTSLSCASGDICLSSSDTVALLPGFELQALLRAHAMHIARGLPPDDWTHEPLNLHVWCACDMLFARWLSHTNHCDGIDISPIPLEHRDLRRAGCVGISQAAVIGYAPQQLHDTLAWAGAGRRKQAQNTLLLTAASTPSFGMWLGPDSETSVLAAVGTLAVTAVSAVGGAMLSLLSPWGSRAVEREAAAAGLPPRRSASGAADAADDDEQEERRVKAITAVRHHGLYDPPRLGTSLALCWPLAAGTDALGRVLVMDVAAPGGGMCVKRVFKGYRGAHIAFVIGSAGSTDCQLVIFTPARNGQLEVWRPLAGDRTARLRAGLNARLLVPWPVLGGADDSAGGGAAAVFVAHGATGAVSKLTGVANGDKT